MGVLRNMTKIKRIKTTAKPATITRADPRDAKIAQLRKTVTEQDHRIQDLEGCILGFVNALESSTMQVAQQAAKDLGLTGIVRPSRCRS